MKLQERIAKHQAQLRAQKFPGFGHALRPFYGFDPDYVPLNNGSFGACPNHVMEVYKEYLVEAERWPDTFLRIQYKPLLDEARKQVAQLVRCSVDDLVLIPNATTGVNAVLRGLNGTWNKGDAILVYETIYGACGKTAQYIIDSNPSFDLQLVKVNLTYPLEHRHFLRQTRDAIEKARKQGLNIRIGVLDAISSLPGVVVPWQDTCRLLKSFNILSLVDGAHAVGQVHLDLAKADPDFFISNCHKWMSAHRGVAFMYVPKRNQHIALGVPTSHDYISPNLPKPEGPPLIPTAASSNYVAVWEWTGTQDLSNYLSLTAALEFRRWMGGERAILEYTSSLAKKGGDIVSSRLGKGSRVMDIPGVPEEERLTASMVNVSIPLPQTVASTSGTNQLAFIAAKLQTALTSNFNTFVPFYVHDGQIWVRISAQVWLQDQDFVWLADRLQDVLKGEKFEIKSLL